MPETPTGPACGNNPRCPLTDGDRQAVQEARTHLVTRAERRDRYAAAIREADGWVLDGGKHMLDAVMAVADAEQASLRAWIAELEQQAVVQPPADQADIGTEFARQADHPDRAGLAAFKTALADQADLRNCIRRACAEADGFRFECLEPHDYQTHADAVLAVLPALADQPALLREAADRIDSETQRLKDAGVLEPDKFRPCRDATAELRRMADEVQQTTAPAPRRCTGQMPPIWTETDPVMVAIAMAAWEGCTTDGHSTVTDDPRNIAAATAAAARAAVRREQADGTEADRG
ncbi:hypothetical protein AB0I84_13125 [Streptomyces spectabilis]|uniref:hypothetical protein n=1 Tax=Streptomyces spectabilis TaxID=68270 RepID=UPI0033CF4BAB